MKYQDIISQMTLEEKCRPISGKHWGGTVGSEVWLQPDIPVALFGVDFNLAVIGKAIFTDENGLIIGALAIIIIFAVDNKILAQAETLLELYLKSDDELNRYAPVSVGSSMVIAPRCRQVLIEGKPINLTRKEFDLLHFFAKHPGQVFSRSQLYEQVWDDFYELGGDASVKSHIKTLRKKLSVLGENLIENVRGVGYRFIPPE